MNMINKLSFLRKQARNNNLIFKKVSHYWNGQQAYNLFDRDSGMILNCSSDTLKGWYDSVIHNNVIKNIADSHFDK